MENPIHWLFDTSSFMPRSRCGTGWTGEFIFSDNLANYLIWVSYTTIPLIILFALKKHKTDAEVLRGFPRWTLAVFAGFIFFCGMGHLFEITVFFWPPYHFYAVWNWLTGVFSVAGIWATWSAFRWAGKRAEALVEEKNLAVEKMNESYHEERKAKEEAIRSKEQIESALEAERIARKAKHDLADELETKNRKLQLVIEQLKIEQNQTTVDETRVFHSNLISRLNKIVQ